MEIQKLWLKKNKTKTKQSVQHVKLCVHSTPVNVHGCIKTILIGKRCDPVKMHHIHCLNGYSGIINYG